MTLRSRIDPSALPRLVFDISSISKMEGSSGFSCTFCDSVIPDSAFFVCYTDDGHLTEYVAFCEKCSFLEWCHITADVMLRFDAGEDSIESIIAKMVYGKGHPGETHAGRWMGCLDFFEKLKKLDARTDGWLFSMIDGPLRPHILNLR